MRSSISILGLTQWDSTIWNDFNVPTGLTKQNAIDLICEECAELEILYPNSDIMKVMIKLWSDVNQASWTKIQEALTATYNPIHNFDRHEEWSDDRDITLTKNLSNSKSNSKTSTDTSSNSNTSTNSGTDTVTGSKNAYNNTTLLDTTKQTTTLGTSNTTNAQGLLQNQTNEQGLEQNTGTERDAGSIDHTGHLYGNIGVTKSQDMIKDEINLRVNNNMYQIIADSFKNKFCLLVY